MKKTIALILATLMLTATLTGCGPKESTPGSSPSTGSKPGETRVIHWLSRRASWPIMHELAERYMAENPGVKVEFEIISDSTTYYQKLKILAASNELPDLFDAEGDSLLSEIASTGVLTDMDELLKEFNYDRMMDIGLNYARLDNGKLYSLCWENNIEYVWYHKDLFTKAGIEKTPETFDELLEVCQKLKDANIAPVSVWPGWALQRWLAFIPFRLTGNDFIEKVKVGEAKMGDPVGIQAAQFFQTMGTKYFQPGWSNSDYTTALETFLGSNAAMYYTGTWQFRSFLDENREIKDDYAYFYMPTLEGAVNGKTDMWAHAGTGTAVTKAKLDDHLKDFIKYVLDNYPESAFYEGKNMPCMDFDTTKGTFSDFDRQVMEDSNNLTSAGYCWDVRLDAASNEVMQKELVNLGMGAITPEDFAARMDAAIAENAPKFFGKD